MDLGQHLDNLDHWEEKETRSPWAEENARQTHTPISSLITLVFLLGITQHPAVKAFKGRKYQGHERRGWLHDMGASRLGRSARFSLT